MKKLLLACCLAVPLCGVANDNPAIQEPTVVMKEMTMMGQKMVVPVVVAPHYLSTLKADMTVKRAAAVLSLASPVAVTNTASFEDGGTVTGTLVDDKGKALGFRRSPWAHKQPVYYYLHPTADGDPVKLEYGGEQLKALSVLALAWVDRTFTAEQQKAIREEEDGRTRSEDDAAQVLWLFRPDKD